MERRALHAVPDDELLARVVALVARSRRTEADLVAHIAEVDARRLYARDACPSMFVWCTDVLHLSEAEAYLRIAAARASREHPALLDMLADGRLHLAGVAKLAPHLTRENAPLLLERAVHKTKRQIEELIAVHAPRPDAPAEIRRLPEGRSPVSSRALPRPGMAQPPSTPTQRREETADPPSPVAGLRPDAVAEPAPELPPAALPAARPGTIEPLAAGRYKVQFTASSALRDKLVRLQALLQHAPDHDLAAVIEAAVTEKLERFEARRFGRTESPRKTLRDTALSRATRHVPAAVRRAVYDRDGGRCRYVDATGRRCQEEARLELHHRHPFAVGGDHRPANVSLLCRAHNALMAAVDYGSGPRTAGREGGAELGAERGAGPPGEQAGRAIESG